MTHRPLFTASALAGAGLGTAGAEVAHGLADDWPGTFLAIAGGGIGAIAFVYAVSYSWKLAGGQLPAIVRGHPAPGMPGRAAEPAAADDRRAPDGTGRQDAGPPLGVRPYAAAMLGNERFKWGL